MLATRKCLTPFIEMWKSGGKIASSLGNQVEIVGIQVKLSSGYTNPEWRGKTEDGDVNLSVTCIR